jgi:putative adhesin
MRHRHLLVAAALAGLELLLAAAPASADFRRQKKLALAPGGELLVDASGGGVTVTGGATDGATVTITSTRDDIEQRYSFEVTSEPGRVKVISRRRPGWSQWFSWNSNGNLHFDVRVPRETRVDLKSSGGGIRVSDLQGNARVRSSGGGLRIADIVGDLDAGSSGGGVEVKQVRGNVRVSSSGGGVDVIEVTGDVAAESSGGGVDVAEVSGNVDASSSGGGVHVNGVGGRVTADSSGGSVSAVLTEGNAAGGSLSSSGGGVSVTLGRDARLSIDAYSSGGSVKCDLPVRTSGKQTRTTLRGDLNGGGSVLKLRSSGGGIHIDAGG